MSINYIERIKKQILELGHINSLINEEPVFIGEGSLRDEKEEEIYKQELRDKYCEIFKKYTFSVKLAYGRGDIDKQTALALLSVRSITGFIAPKIVEKLENIRNTIYCKDIE